MRRKPVRHLPLLFVLLALPAFAGCQRIQARMLLKEGNRLYLNENYRQALEQFQAGVEKDPSATFAWRSVGLTAVALYRPGVKTAENDKYADLAINAFRTYLKDHATDAKVREYMIATLMNAERHDEALKELRDEAARQPNNVGVNQAIVTTYLKSGRLEDALNWAQRPGYKADPQIFYSVAVGCWDKAYRDPMLDTAARGKVVETGLNAAKRAIDLKPDYFEAMAYYNLLFRERAKLELDPLKAQEWIAEADRWRDKAKQLLEAQKARDAAAAAKAAA